MRARSLIAALAIALSSVLISAPIANAQETLTTVKATIDGREVAIAVSGEPIPLYPDKIADVTVDVANDGTEPIEIASVQLVGRVLGLTFFKYTAGMELTVAPGETRTVNYKLDLTDLQRQATGLMDTQLVIRNASRDVLVTVDTVADIRGSLISVYGLLGFALLILTALAFVNAVIAIARHKGSLNRLRRGLHLLSPGIGVGLVLVFTASVARWWVPRTEWWLLAAGITGAVFFLLGYFSPTPDGDDERHDGEIDGEAGEFEEIAPPSDGDHEVSEDVADAVTVVHPREGGDTYGDDDATVVALREGSDDHEDVATIVRPSDS